MLCSLGLGLVRRVLHVPFLSSFFSGSGFCCIIGLTSGSLEFWLRCWGVFVFALPFWLSLKPQTQNPKP